MQARDLGLRLEKFAEVGLEEQAVGELERMMANSHKEGFLSFIQREQSQQSLSSSQSQSQAQSQQAQGLAEGRTEGQELAPAGAVAGTVAIPQTELFARGQEISAMSWQDMVTRQAVEQVLSSIVNNHPPPPP